MQTGVGAGCGWIKVNGIISFFLVLDQDGQLALPGTDGSPPPYIATITIWIADAAAFDAAADRYQASIRADVDKFTNAELIAQRDTIVAVATS